MSDRRGPEPYPDAAQLLARLVHGERPMLDDVGGLTDEVVELIDKGWVTLFDPTTGEPIPLRCSCGQRFRWRGVPVDGQDYRMCPVCDVRGDVG
jgi:hypothetical protein